MAELKTRLYLDSVIKSDQTIDLIKKHSHFLVNVLRLKYMDQISVFNSESGEWSARIIDSSKKMVVIKTVAQLRRPEREYGPWLAFALIKKTRMDFLIEKATELGVERLMPVITHFTGPQRFNLDRLVLHSIEAVEQSGRLSKPEICPVIDFGTFLKTWPKNRHLFFGDETGKGKPVGGLLDEMLSNEEKLCGFFTGPEGGFSNLELSTLNKLIYAHGMDLGPRTLRSETAAIAALSAWNAILD